MKPWQAMKRRPTLLTVVFGALFGAAVWELLMWFRVMLEQPVWRWKPVFFVCMGLPAIFMLVFLLAVWQPGRLQAAQAWRQRFGAAARVLAVLAGAAVSWFFVYARWSEIFNGTFPRLFVYTAATLLMAWLLTGKAGALISWNGLAAALVILGCTFSLAVAFQRVVDYPFPLAWSEGNRLWDYSMLYGRRLYLYPPDKTIFVLIDLGRQSLWGLPFLFGDASIWFMRFWDALLFTLPYILLGWFVFYRRVEGTVRWFLMGLWTLLFLAQGPIYTPLVLAAILVAGARRLPLTLGLVLVALAGYYTYNSRITWIFAPAMWSVLDAFVGGRASAAAARWWRAAAYGLAGLTGGYLLPEMILPRLAALLNGGSAEGPVLSADYITATGERQPLLWERLLPNPTNPLGILPQLLIAMLPLVILLALFAAQKPWRLNLWQRLVIVGCLLAFLAVGIVASVKIGGGSNLHNLDMFLLGLIFVTGLACEAGLADWLFEEGQQRWLRRGLVVLAVLVPVLPAMLAVRTFALPAPDVVNEALTSTQKAVAEANARGEVLFIDHRQLLTFGYIKGVPLVPEYEKKVMMDEAMADNAAYFEPFHRDLYRRRFSLIISEQMSIKYQGGEYHFGNENDAWVKWVSIPVLCYYTISETFPDVGLQILTPRPQMLRDPAVKCPLP